jgi:flagellar hook protein FlgE
MIVQTASSPQDLIIPVGSKDPARATQNVNFACNLNKNTPEILEGANEADIARGTWATEFNIYDSYGRVHNLAVTFTRVPGSPNQWQVETIVDPQAEAATNTLIGVGTTEGMGTTFLLNFDNNGTLLSVTDTLGNVTAPTGEIILQAAFDVSESNEAEGGGPYRQTFNLNLGTIGSQRNTVTQSASQSSTKAFSQDGYTMGYLDNFRIDSSGQITGVYSNGTSRLIGQIALASFANQGGLEKAGNNYYVQSNNSGLANVSESGIAGKGSLLSGTLEMSNVDLTDQFTDMIVTQRGFQASSKTIQTADTLLETVLSLKR